MNGNHFAEFITFEGIEKNVRDDNWNLTFTFLASKEALYVRTDIGCWKIIREDTLGCFILYHMNRHGETVTLHDLLYGKYHHQSVVAPGQQLAPILQYIDTHDTLKKQWMQDPNYPVVKSRKRRISREQKRRLDRKMKNRCKAKLFRRLEREMPLLQKCVNYDPYA